MQQGLKSAGGMVSRPTRPTLLASTGASMRKLLQLEVRTAMRPRGKAQSSADGLHHSIVPHVEISICTNLCTVTGSTNFQDLTPSELQGYLHL